MPIRLETDSRPSEGIAPPWGTLQSQLSWEVPLVLALPPIRLIRYDPATERLVYDGLTSVIAGHPQAKETYTFYEELDRWLGPRGDGLPHCIRQILQRGIRNE